MQQIHPGGAYRGHADEATKTEPSSAIIYLVEGSATVRAQVAAHIAGAESDPSGRLITSHLARLECRVKPLRDGDAALLGTYDALFTRTRLVVFDLTTAVLELLSP